MPAQGGFFLHNLLIGDAIAQVDSAVTDNVYVNSNSTFPIIPCLVWFDVILWTLSHVMEIVHIKVYLFCYDLG